MAKFNDKHKEEMGGKYFGQGIHLVKIGEIKSGETDDGKEYFDVTVLGPNDEEGTARLWFHTDGSIKYSFNTLRRIFVHNAPKSKKELVHKQVDALKDTEGLEKACASLIGKECWYSVFENKKRKFIGNDGQERYSYDRNIYGYEPKPPKVVEDEPEVTDGDITEDGEIVGF